MSAEDYLRQRNADQVRRYDLGIAKVLGLREAIFMEQLVFRCKLTELDYREGRRPDGPQWRSSISEWQRDLGGYSRSEIKRIIKNCKNAGVLYVRSQYEKNRYGRSIWFYPDYEKLLEIAKAGKGILDDEEEKRTGKDTPPRQVGDIPAASGVRSKEDSTHGTVGSGSGRTSVGSKKNPRLVRNEPQIGPKRATSSKPPSSIPSSSIPKSTPNRHSPGVCSTSAPCQPDEEPHEETHVSLDPHERGETGKGRSACRNDALPEKSSRKNAAIGSGKALPRDESTSEKSRSISVPFDNLEGMTDEQLERLIRGLATRIKNGKHDSIQNFWKALVAYYYGTNEFFTPITPNDRKRTPELTAYCKEANISMPDLVRWCVEEWVDLDEQMGWSALTRLPIYSSILNLKDKLVECYKCRQLEEESEWERDKETKRLYMNIEEVPKYHPLRDQLAGELEKIEDGVVADHYTCIPFNQVPEIMGHKGRRFLEVERDVRMEAVKSRVRWGRRQKL